MASDLTQVALGSSIHGSIRVPGDKAISHRLAMLGGIASGVTSIQNFAESADCQSTLGCLRSLGVKVTQTDSTVTTVTIEGRSRQLTAPAASLDAGNSGTTVRM